MIMMSMNVRLLIQDSPRVVDYKDSEQVKGEFGRTPTYAMKSVPKSGSPFGDLLALAGNSPQILGRDFVQGMWGGSVAASATSTAASTTTSTAISAATVTSSVSASRVS